tara:strand:- start:717 stop:1565 length:849 start_codon:yes stop_codon:yes gene_type:complete
MKCNKIIYTICIVLSIALCLGQERIITIGGSVTDIVFELGYGKHVIATDQSSTIPEEVKNLPQVGYIRAISAEGILSLNPSKIITTTDIGPPNVVEQLKNSGVDLYIFDSPYSFKEITLLVKDIANCINKQEDGIKLNNNLLNIHTTLEEIKNQLDSKQKIVFFMNPSIGSFSAAGSKTKADYLIQYLGGENIFANEFNRYSKVTKENIIKHNPDIILVGSTMGKDEETSKSIFYNSKEFKNIKAVMDNNVFSIDMGSHLTFGSSFPKNTLVLLRSILQNDK